jgi:hypothetical protein
MTPADLARKNAIAFECKKDGLRQTQAGTWKVTFTVLDMDERLTRAFPGTRYQAVLVEIDENEMPVSKPSEKESKSSDVIPATPQPTPHPPAAAKRPWRDMQPSAQAAMLCDKPVFRAFLAERYTDEWHESMTDGAECVRLICGVASRSMLNDGAHRVIWHQLQTEYQAWEGVGA